MEPQIAKIFEDINRLEEVMSEVYVSKKGKDYASKKELSDCLAWVVTEIRRKYELTSFIYCVSESNAAEKYNREYGEEKGL